MSVTVFHVVCVDMSPILGQVAGMQTTLYTRLIMATILLIGIIDTITMEFDVLILKLHIQLQPKYNKLVLTYPQHAQLVSTCEVPTPRFVSRALLFNTKQAQEPVRVCGALLVRLQKMPPLIFALTVLLESTIQELKSV